MMTLTNVETTPEDIEFEVRQPVDGFGWVMGLIDNKDGKTALIMTPVSPDGHYQYSFVICREMVDTLIENLNALKDEVTHTSEDVERWLATVRGAEGQTVQ